MDRKRKESPSPIKFGTDGWRGIIAQDFTFDNVRACARSVAEYVREQDMADHGLVVGYDTRFLSESFAAAVAEVLAAGGIHVFLCPHPTPTPVVSYGIVARGAAGAIIITASHNPAIWNGFKYKSEYAGSASPEIVAALEGRIPDILARGPVERLPLEEGLKLDLIEHFDPAPPYLEHIGGLVDLEALRRAGLKIAVDSMYGAGAGYFQRILAGGTTEVLEINAERNPLFPGIRPEPIAQHLGKLAALVKESRATVGLATDGDADRLGIMDEQGQFVTPLQVLALLALYLLDVRGERGAIVKSITSTNMLFRLGELFSVPVLETPVGFKYIGPRMISEQALVGGEESGGYGFRGHIPERDGILAGLYFLDLMIRKGLTPTQLVRYLFDRVGPHYFHRVDLDFPARERDAIQQRLSLARPAEIEGTRVSDFNTLDGHRFNMVDGSWLQFRFSGTEPILRIYSESSSPEGVKRLLEAGRRLAGV